MENKINNPHDDPNKVIQRNVEVKYKSYINQMDRLNQIIRDEKRKSDLDKSCN